jgi:hypothetical protein
MGAEVVMRIEGWETLLNDHITVAYRHGVKWGEHDCALWCADWVFKATGKDLFSDWKGKYKTSAGAAKLMKRRGFNDVASIADAALKAVLVGLAQRGDVMLHPEGTLGICNGKHSFFLTNESVTMIDTLQCLKAWRVE